MVARATIPPPQAAPWPRRCPPGCRSEDQRASLAAPAHQAQKRWRPAIPADHERLFGYRRSVGDMRGGQATRRGPAVRLHAADRGDDASRKREGPQPPSPAKKRATTTVSDPHAHHISAREVRRRVPIVFAHACWPSAPPRQPSRRRGAAGWVGFAGLGVTH